MAVQIILKNSSAEDKRPTAPQLANGEIALNYNAAGAFLTCKDTDGNIQQVGGVKISEVAPDSPVKQTLWFQPSSLTLFVYDGNAFLPVAGGGGGGTPGGDITTIIGNNGIDASEVAGVVTLDVELAGGDDGLEFRDSKLKASVASASQLGSVKIGDAISVTSGGTITPRIASTSQTGIVKIGDSIEVSSDGTITPQIASTSQTGIVKIGSGIDIALDGTISVDIPQTLTFRGSVDLNNPPTGQINPDPAQGGDAYVASVGADPIDNGWTGIGGDSALAGDLVVFDGTEWELVSTGGIVQGVEGGEGITALTSGGIATVAVDAGAGLDFDADDKLIVEGYPNLSGGNLDERYLRLDDQAGDQTVESTGTTTFDGGLTVATKDALINGVTVGLGAGSVGTNTAVGSGALAANTTGSNNTANGRSALYSNTTGINNTANGVSALSFNTTGNFNTANGNDALYSNTIGNNNTANGFSAGRFKQDGTSVTDFNNCSYLGYDTRASASNQVQLGNSTTTTFAYGAVQDRSDARDKTDIRDTLLGLDFIKSLRPVDFRWDMRDDYFDKEEYQEDELRTRQVLNPDYVPESDEPEFIDEEYTETVTKERLVAVAKDGSRSRDRFHHGLIAQEVKAAADAQGVDFAGYQDHSINGGLDVLSIGYTEMIAPLIKAVQELSAENAELKTRLDALEAAATS